MHNICLYLIIALGFEGFCCASYAQDIDAYCKQHYGFQAAAEGTEASALVLNQNDANSWRCVTGVDMESLCHTQFGANTHAVVIPPNDASSWRCQK